MLLLIAAAAVAAIRCPVETARYTLRGDPSVTASFRAADTGPDWPSDLVLRIHFARTGHDTWWLPWNGGTDNRQNLASTTDVRAAGWRAPSIDGGPRPLGSIEYIGMDESYDIQDAVPKRGTEAPGHFLLPHLGEAVWYHGQPAYSDRPEKRLFDCVGS